MSQIYDMDLSSIPLKDLTRLAKVVSDEIYLRYNDKQLAVESLLELLQTYDEYNVIYGRGVITVDAKRSGSLINKEVKVLYKNNWIKLWLITNRKTVNQDIFELTHKIRKAEGETNEPVFN